MMTMLHVWRLWDIPIRRLSVRHLGSLPYSQRSHIYEKTYTKDELLKYLTDHIAYSSSDYIVTCVPQGLNFLNSNRWSDSEKKPVCDIALQDMIPDLCNTLGTDNCFITKHPRRSASGLTVFSRNFKAFQTLRRHFTTAKENLERIYTYLVVVVGCPPQKVEKTLRIEQVEDGGSLNVRILERSAIDSARTVDTKYDHRVLDSTEHVSLVKVSVSYDLRDCVRHILAQRCFTPILGDDWSAKRTVDFLFGAPIACIPGTRKVGPYDLKPEILEKLQLTKDEQNLIPIHAHLYGLKFSLKKKSAFFVSVPPTETFIWTCKQLGLDGIRQFAPDLVESVHPATKRRCVE